MSLQRRETLMITGGGRCRSTDRGRRGDAGGRWSHDASVECSCGDQRHLTELFGWQCGVASRAQVVGHGTSLGQIRAELGAERWQQVHRNVYASFSGALPRLAEFWAGVLTGGTGAVLSHESAAELDGLIDPQPPGTLVHVTVPVERRVSRQPGVRIHYLHRLPTARHPTFAPPRLRIEETVLGLTDASRTAVEAMGWVLRACQRRLTTPERLLVAMSQHKKMCWRPMLEGALTDAGDGVQSLLEMRYLHDVERAHGLPRADRQRKGRVLGARVWRDVRYSPYRTIVELDGRLGHEDDGRLRDMRRDNVSTVGGADSLRFGWTDVTYGSCEAAAQVALVLARNGWAGTARACSPSCLLPVIMRDRRRYDDVKSS